MSSDCDYTEDGIIIDISDVQGTNCYMDDDARLEIERRVKVIPTEAIHFIDSGNYHYMSLFFLERIKEPFDLIVFDNHTDYQKGAFGGITSCGGWIREAYERFHNLNKIYLIGTDQELAAGESFSDKVELISDSKEISSNKFPAYISIDKDVLSEMYYKANWSQGKMTLNEMVSLVTEIMDSRNVIGIDICGGTGDENDIAGNAMNRKADFAILEALK